METIRHGEVILHPTTLPEEAILKEDVLEYTVARSETGHHHVLTGKKSFKVFSLHGETYLEITDTATLWHRKTGPDVHKEHTIKPSVYKVIIKKHFDYFQKKMSEVRD